MFGLFSILHCYSSSIGLPHYSFPTTLIVMGSVFGYAQIALLFFALHTMCVQYLEFGVLIVHIISFQYVYFPPLDINETDRIRQLKILYRIVCVCVRVNEARFSPTTCHNLYKTLSFLSSIAPSLLHSCIAFSYTHTHLNR